MPRRTITGSQRLPNSKRSWVIIIMILVDLHVIVNLTIGLAAIWGL